LDLFPLALFPQGSLSSSVIPVVWVGMSVVCFFNLRLGWVLSGLVVPGYLVPLMLLKPWSAAVVVFEGFLTYFLIWLVSEYLSRWAYWCNFFGRDRFFALVLCSIAVRMFFDGWLLPELGDWATAHWQIAFDYRNNLHSFGLVIVSLIANQFWKTGIIKGLIPLITTLTLTLLIVRYGLMELTNFNLSNIGYLYEDMATSILATPKAYIILVSTAFLASRMNLYYGWDYNGILIPSLLALQWYQPVKILATILESGIILWLATLLLKTPLLSKITIEGARKLLLFFNISFVYKILLGYAILDWFPALKATDYFGFGYLLSTLMAVKIHDKAIFARLTRATLQTSFTAVIAANLLGFTLTLLPFPKLFKTTPEGSALPAALDKTVPGKTQTLETLLQQEQIDQYQTKLTEAFISPSSSDIDIFTSALTHLQTYLKQPGALPLQKAGADLAKIHYRLERTDHGRYLYLHEEPPLRGWGAYVLDTQAQSGLGLEIPAPLDELGVFDAGVGLFHGFGARSLAISGSSRKKNHGQVAADALKNPQGLFQVFHRLINPHNSLQIRAYSDGMPLPTAPLAGTGTSLWIKERLPESLDLTKLKQLLTDYRVFWGAPPFHNQQRELSQYGFAELLLTQQDLKKLLTSPLIRSPGVTIENIVQALHLEGYLQEWVLNRKEDIAPKGSERYQPPKQEELLFFDEQILTPLLATIRNAPRLPGTALDDELQIIAQSAGLVGYRLIKYRDGLSQQDYWVLAEQDRQPMRHWGLYVFRLGAANPYVLQIPRPIYEINSFEYGVALFERLQAQALLIGGSHPEANFDGSADLINANNKNSVFNLVNQVLLREAHDTGMMLVSTRAFSYRTDRPFPDTDVIFSLAEGLLAHGQMDKLPQNLLTLLEHDGMSVQLADGSEQTVGYEVGNTAQAFYLAATANKHYAVLWLSPKARAGYRQQSANVLQAAQFSSLQIPSLDENVGAYLEKLRAFSSNTTVDGQFRDLLTQYLKEQDVLRLQQVLGDAEAKGYQVARLIDRNSKQAFIMVKDNAGIPCLLVNLAARAWDATYVDGNSPLTAQVAGYINQRKTWLLRRPD